MHSYAEIIFFYFGLGILLPIQIQLLEIENPKKLKLYSPLYIVDENHCKAYKNVQKKPKCGIIVFDIKKNLESAFSTPLLIPKLSDVLRTF
jgi:hypothetical protein